MMYQKSNCHTKIITLSRNVMCLSIFHSIKLLHFTCSCLSLSVFFFLLSYSIFYFSITLKFSIRLYVYYTWAIIKTVYLITSLSKFHKDSLLSNLHSLTQNKMEIVAINVSKKLTHDYSFRLIIISLLYSPNSRSAITVFFIFDWGSVFLLQLQPDLHNLDD